MMVNNPIIEPVTQDKTAQKPANAANAAEGADFNNVLAEMKAVKDTQEAEKNLAETEKTQDKASSEEKALADAKNNLLKKLKKLEEMDKIPVQLNALDGSGLFGFLHNTDNQHSMSIDSLTKDDINFFKTCSERGGINLNDINLQAAQAKIMVSSTANEISYKSIDFSKGLSSLIEYTYTTQKPVRLDFQGDSSVILRVDQKGLLSAQFIPGNPAMEYALKAGLPDLRNRFEAEGIPYKELSYRDNSQQNRKNKENKGDRQ
jgi:hypothetical protein